MLRTDVIITHADPFLYIYIYTCILTYIKKDDDELKDAIDKKKIREEKMREDVLYTYNDEYPLGGTAVHYIL